ncbi:MAG: M81 family metallopeptidase [Pseudomonadota bacterium]
MAQKRVYLAALQHESHSFSAANETLDAFILMKDEALEAHGRSARTEISGVYAQAERFDWDLVGGPCYIGMAGGPVTDDAYATMVDDILKDLKSNLPVDGVVLVLHGSSLSESCDDIDGDLTGRIREIVGDVPIAVTVDLHANISDTLIENIDILTSYRTTPHVDLFETAERAAAFLDATLEEKITPRLSVRRGPMLDALDRGRTLDPDGPMCAALKLAQLLQEKSKHILAIEINVGFAWGDCSDAGPNIVTLTNGGSSDAQREVDDASDALLDMVWRTKSDTTIQTLSVKEAEKLIAGETGGGAPLLIADLSDNPGGGATGDATALLKMLIDANIPNSVFFSIADAEIVKAAEAAGCGNRITGKLGGNVSPDFGGGPLEFEGTVVSLFHGRYVRKGPYMNGMEANLGPSVRLKIKSTDVIVTTIPTQSEEREQLKLFDLDPETISVLFLKGQNHLRADYDAFTSRLFYVDGGGICSRNYAIFPYKNLRRPIWPLDDVKR